MAFLTIFRSSFTQAARGAKSDTAAAAATAPPTHQEVSVDMMEHLPALLAKHQAEAQVVRNPNRGG